MSIIADKMKDHINTLTNIKIKLIKKNIWSADNISSSLKSNKNIDHVDISDNKDRLYIHMKDGYQRSSNTLDLDTYHEISKSTSSMIRKNKTMLDQEESQYVKEVGLDKMTHMMYHLSHLPRTNTIVMEL